MGKAHLSTRMRRDHTRQGTATHTDAAVPQTLGGCAGGVPLRPNQGVAHGHNYLRRTCRYTHQFHHGRLGGAWRHAPRSPSEVSRFDRDTVCFATAKTNSFAVKS